MVKTQELTDLRLLELMPVGVVLTDLEGRIIYTNPAMRSMVGYSEEEVIGRRPNLWKSNNHTYGFYREMWQTISSGRKWQGTIQNRRKDGSLFWAVLDIAPIVEGEEIVGYMGILRDISAEYSQQHQLMEYYESLYLNLLDNVEVGIGLIDQHRNLVYLNRQCKKWLGAKGSIEGYMSALLEIPFVSCCIDKSFSDQQTHELTVEVDAGIFRFATFPVIHDEELKGIVFVMVDITKEKTIEKELNLYREFLEQEIENRTYALRLAKRDLEAQAMELREAHENLKFLYQELKAKNEQLEELDRLKTEFVFTVSHELRTPLTTIREGVALVLDKELGPLTEEQEDMLSTVLGDVDRLTRIVSDFLDLSKIESGRLTLELQEVSVRELVDWVVRSLRPVAEAKGIELRSDCSEIVCWCDKDRISQVLLNLVGNAVKFTEEGYVEVRAFCHEDKVWFCVEDTGPGVPDEFKEKIFDKFFQVGRKDRPGSQGTGLGLPISKGLVELHGGRLWVEDRDGGGSRFWFVIPNRTEEVGDGASNLGNR